MSEKKQAAEKEKKERIIKVSLSRLIKIMSMSDDEVFSMIKESYKDSFVESKHNYAVIPGKRNDILLVAHADTVRRDSDNNIVHFKDRIINLNDKGERAILGADDRAGVNGCLLLHEEYGVPVLITNDEESGAIGARCFCDNQREFDFSQTKLIMELDRRGFGHYVTYNDISKNVERYLKDYIGLKEESGSFSDCMYLTTKYKISSINLSIGYHSEHTSGEYLSIPEYFHQLKFACKVVENLDKIDREVLANTTKSYSYGGYGRSYGGGSYWDGESYRGYEDDSHHCFRAGGVAGKGVGVNTHNGGCSHKSYNGGKKKHGAAAAKHTENLPAIAQTTVKETPAQSSEPPKSVNTPAESVFPGDNLGLSQSSLPGFNPEESKKDTPTPSAVQSDSASATAEMNTTDTYEMTHGKPKAAPDNSFTDEKIAELEEYINTLISNAITEKMDSITREIIKERLIDKLINNSFGFEGDFTSEIERLHDEYKQEIANFDGEGSRRVPRHI